MGDKSAIRIGPLNDWEPRYFVVAHLIVNNHGDVTGYDTDRSGVYAIKGLNAKLHTIETFSEAVYTGDALGPKTIPFPEGSEHTTTFPIKGPCYVIFVLDDPWNFTEEGSGVCMPHGADARYADLYQVPKSGSPVRGKKFEGLGCRVLYFSAKTVANSSKTHKFKINAERVLPNNKVAETALDPDIKNDGTSPQWP